jgi:anti-sigma28 factor (negative regulator of flagellin synthesis)
MAIREVIGQGAPVDPVKGSKSSQQARGKAAARETKDRVEVSDEARALYEADQSRRIEDIRKKIAEGFYDRREVAEKVADAMLKEMKNESAEE